MNMMDKHQRSKKEDSKGGEKKSRRKLYTQPHEPQIPFANGQDVSGSMRSAGVKEASCSSSAEQALSKKKQGSTRKYVKDEDDVLGSDRDVFVKPHMSPRRIFYGAKPSSAEKKRRHTISMTRDMKKLEEAIDLKQRRKKNKKNGNIKAQTDCSPFKVPLKKMGGKESVDRAGCQRKKLNKLSCRKRHNNLEEGETCMQDEALTMTSKRKEDGHSSHASNHGMLGKHGVKPDKGFESLDELYNPSQELFTDTESGNETDTQASVQRTVSRFLSSQEAQNDFRAPDSTMVQRSSLSAGAGDTESDVSESSDDGEANETALEKEIHSFFKNEKQQSPRGHREVVLPSEVSLTPIQQGTVDGISDESEVICAGQKMQSHNERDDVMDKDTNHSTPDSIGELEDAQRLSDDSSSTCSQDVAVSKIVLGQDDRDNNNSGDIVPRGKKSQNQKQITSQKYGSQTNQDVEMAATSEDSENSSSSDIEVGESSDRSRTPFHSTPAEPSHCPQLPKEQAHSAVSPSLPVTEIGKQMFRLYCHRNTTPRILEALRACGSIDGNTLASATVDNGPTCRPIEMIHGKIFEGAAERTSSEVSLDLFEDNSNGIDGDVEKKKDEQLTKPASLDSAIKRKRSAKDDTETKPKKSKKNKKKRKVTAKPGDKTFKTRLKVINGPIKGDARKKNAKDDAKTKPKKSKKNKKKRKVTAKPGDNTFKTRLKVINGPIKGDARKKNEYRWKREMREQSKCPWSPITLEPSLESDLGVLRCLKAAARAVLNQRVTHLDRDANLEEEDQDTGTFVNLLSFPDVFMTKKKDQPSFRKVPPSEIQILHGL
ncbi:uncharacterized protein LOC763713 isoform X2 [Strongylocentrotus purpuratus]|uniref:Uncharacterized protein n=1 Tax=Strongylocentrotus purpuratus TaxID=7668 RepID=A0A7M7GGM2_STRPU|nr:uncharacterized protein LOC763713 isoform X2 [Strongylocentrotus purpuratus]